VSIAGHPKLMTVDGRVKPSGDACFPSKHARTLSQSVLVATALAVGSFAGVMGVSAAGFLATIGEA
jgi:hypothetical protein